MLLSSASVAQAKGKKVWVCHRTGSATNPYTLLRVSVNSGAFEGHLAHRNNPKEWKDGRRDYIQGLDRAVEFLRHCHPSFARTIHFPRVLPGRWVRPRPRPEPGPGPSPSPDPVPGHLIPGQTYPVVYPLDEARRMLLGLDGGGVMIRICRTASAATC